MSYMNFKKLALAGLATLMVTGVAFAEGEMPAAPAPEAAAAPANDDFSFKMSGTLREYFGQYNSGVKNTSAYMQEFGEANLAANVTAGAITGYFELESRDLAVVSAVQRRLDAKFGDLKVSFGTIKPKESYALADDAETGTKTSDSASFGFYKGELIKTELDGLRLEYKIGKIKAGVSLYERDALNATTYAMVDSTSDTAVSKSKFTAKAYKEGSATQFGAYGDLGPIYFHLSSISSKTDAHTSTATVLNHSGSQLGVRYNIEKGFYVSVDSGSKSIAQDTTYKKKYADSALQVKYTLGNQQSAVVTLASMTYQDEKYASTKKNDYALSNTNLVYNIPMGKGAEFKVLYASEANKPEIAGGTSVTKSYVGAGAYVKF